MRPSAKRDDYIAQAQARSNLRAKRAMRICPPSGQIFFQLSCASLNIFYQFNRLHREKKNLTIVTTKNCRKQKGDTNTMETCCFNLNYCYRNMICRHSTHILNAWSQRAINVVEIVLNCQTLLCALMTLSFYDKNNAVAITRQGQSILTVRKLYRQ